MRVRNCSRKTQVERMKIGAKCSDDGKVLLSATGRMRDEKREFRKVLFCMPTDLEKDIDTYCLGSKQAIMMYLLRRGLDDIINKKEIVFFEIES